MLPTFCEMASVQTPRDTDGISLLPTLLGQRQRRHDYLYWEFTERGGKQAIRRGDFKAVRLGVSKNPHTKIELYNLARDLGETENIAAQHPKIVEEMKRLFRDARIESKNFPLYR
jgi:arylsulfatase A-like enzyme